MSVKPTEYKFTETIKASELQRAAKFLTCTFIVSEEPEVRKNLQLYYDPSQVSVNMQCRLMDIRGAGAAQEVYKDDFCKVVVAWNLTDDNGAPIALTPEYVGTREFFMIADILNQVVNDHRPN